MNYLLLGAGFSRNWGGWLAEELRGELLGHLQAAPAIYQQLLRTPNFEDVLYELQRIHRQRGNDEARANLRAMEAAILSTFADMNHHFAEIGFEWSNMIAQHVGRFMARFDAIFTLNQDLLLELHYARREPLDNRWDGFQFPGIRFPAGWWQAAPQENVARQWFPAAEFEITPRNQPIYKLHGSVNWREGEGNSILVMGGGKAEAIEQSPLLSGYARIFRQSLIRGDAKLMIVGYGFGDQHINATLLDASQNHGLKIYLVDPRGLRIFDAPPDQLVRQRNDLAEMRFVGISTRSLRDTFTTDQHQQRSLERFLGDDHLGVAR